MFHWIILYIYALISTDSLIPNENKVLKCTWRLKKPALNYNKTMLIWYLDGKFFSYVQNTLDT